MGRDKHWEKIESAAAAILLLLLWHWFGFGTALVVLFALHLIASMFRLTYLAGRFEHSAEEELVPLGAQPPDTQPMVLQALDGFGARVESLGFRAISPWLSQRGPLEEDFGESCAIGIWHSPATNDVAIFYAATDGCRKELRRRGLSGDWIVTATGTGHFTETGSDSPGTVTGVGDYDPRDLWLAHQEHCTQHGTTGAPIEIGDPAAFLARLDREDEEIFASTSSSAKIASNDFALPTLRELITRGRRNAGLTAS